jgi:hypothetical protein
MTKVGLCMSADWGSAALLDSDWATPERLVAPGVRVDVVESRCRYQGEVIAGRFRVTQTWVTPDGRPQLGAVQYTSAPAETHPSEPAAGASAPPHLGPALLRLWTRSSLTFQTTRHAGKSINSGKIFVCKVGSCSLPGPWKLPLTCTGTSAGPLPCDSARVRPFSPPRTDV